MDGSLQSSVLISLVRQSTASQATALNPAQTLTDKPAATGSSEKFSTNYFFLFWQQVVLWFNMREGTWTASLHNTTHAPTKLILFIVWDFLFLSTPYPN